MKRNNNTEKNYPESEVGKEHVVLSEDEEMMAWARLFYDIYEEEKYLKRSPEEV